VRPGLALLVRGVFRSCLIRPLLFSASPEAALFSEGGALWHLAFPSFFSQLPRAAQFDFFLWAIPWVLLALFEPATIWAWSPEQLSRACGSALGGSPCPPTGALFAVRRTAWHPSVFWRRTPPLAASSLFRLPVVSDRGPGEDRFRASLPVFPEACCASWQGFFDQKIVRLSGPPPLLSFFFFCRWMWTPRSWCAGTSPGLSLAGGRLEPRIPLFTFEGRPFFWNPTT